MNNTHQENGTMAGPLVFTVPAYGFVMALISIGWGGTNPGTVSANMRGTHKETQTRFRMADAQIGASNPFTGFLGRQETCGRR